MCVVASTRFIIGHNSVHPASTGARERVGIPGAPSPLSETKTAKVVALKPEWVVQHIFIRGSWALTITSEAAVPLLALILCWWRYIHDFSECLGTIRELVFVQSVVCWGDKIGWRRRVLR